MTKGGVLLRSKGVTLGAKLPTVTIAYGDGSRHRARRLPLKNYGDARGRRKPPDAEQRPRVLRKIRVVPVGIRDERGDGIDCFDIELVVQSRSSHGFVALDHWNLAHYDVLRTHSVEVVEHCRFRAQFS